MYACVLLAAIVQQSRGYLNPFLFYFFAFLSLFPFLSFGPAVPFARALLPAFGSDPASIMQQRRPRCSCRNSFGAEYFSGRPSGQDGSVSLGSPRYYRPGTLAIIATRDRITHLSLSVRIEEI